MRYLVFASDYDGILARDGRVEAETVSALTRLRESGRALVLVTGRELDDLLRIFPEVTLFHRVVAENGAVLYRPESRDVQALADPPHPDFLDGLRARGVAPLSVGRVIVATREPHETAVLETIRDTWRYHLRQGDYSRWLRDSIKDAALAAEVARIETSPDMPPAESRRGIKSAIEGRYTLPA
jgi:hydroxymethylpyrimidine pyrophosphatase-like HAD family hydrolase